MRLIPLCLIAIFPLFGADNLAHDSAEFAFSLYTKTEKASGNTLFSPYSIFTCLSMAYMGARSSTAEEMHTVLNLSMSPDDLVSALGSYHPPIHLANSMWMSREILVLADFRKTIEEGFSAVVQTIDFHHPSSAASTINAWIADHTDQKIPHLLLPNDISAATRLVLANAIYYKGAWQTPFNPKKTASGAFWTDANSCLDVQMMEQTAFFAYTEDDQFQLVALPFAQEDKNSPRVAMVILLPKNGNEPFLSFDSWDKWLSQMENYKVHLKLPKFILNERTDLNQTLMQMGLKKAFSPVADFSGIDGRHDLYLSKVVHQAYMAVDEAGVIAAAATAASINVTSVAPKPQPIVDFIADHPFLFFLVDLDHKIPIFMGKLTTPP